MSVHRTQLRSKAQAQRGSILFIHSRIRSPDTKVVFSAIYCGSVSPGVVGAGVVGAGVGAGVGTGVGAGVVGAAVGAGVGAGVATAVGRNANTWPTETSMEWSINVRSLGFWSRD